MLPPCPVPRVGHITLGSLGCSRAGVSALLVSERARHPQNILYSADAVCGFHFPRGTESHALVSIAIGPLQRRPASPYLARGFDSLKDAQINNSPRKEQAQTQVPANPPRIPNPRASLDVQDIPAREEGELLVSSHGLPSSRGPLTLEMPLLQNNLVNNHRHWQLLAKEQLE